MAHLQQLVRAVPLVVALALLPGCDKNEPTGGDPRVDGITQTPLPEPDLSILGDQKLRYPARPSAAVAVATTTATSTAPATTGTATGPEAPSTTTAAATTTSMPASTTAPATTTEPTTTQGTTSAPASQPSAATGADLEPNPFTDPKSKISLRLHQGWVELKGANDTAFGAPVKDEDATGNIAPNVVFAGAPAPGAKPSLIKDILENSSKQYQKTFDGYHEIRHEMTTINGRDGGVIEYTMTVQKTVKVHGEQYWVVTDGNVYSVTFTSLESTFEKNKPLFDVIVQTVTVP